MITSTSDNLVDNDTSFSLSLYQRYDINYSITVKLGGVEGRSKKLVTAKMAKFFFS